MRGNPNWTILSGFMGVLMGSRVFVISRHDAPGGVIKHRSIFVL